MIGKSLPHPGALVISLDFELRWGVREKGLAYTPSVLGARAVIPRMLEMFAEFGVAATWATVGFLFAGSRQELERYSPRERPAYADPGLSPYGDEIGRDEVQDPVHFAPSLIETIRTTPEQEIATHTFSHFYCKEAGQTAEAFRADLAAACGIAEKRGVQLRSIVFPRNQHNPAYDAILREHGIVAYRGNPLSWMWRFQGARQSAKPGKRLARLADTYIDLGGSDAISWTDVSQPGGLADVRATALLRPYNPRLRHLEPLRLRRIAAGLRAAARGGRIFHLWWHPHNFGAHCEENLAFLRRVLLEFGKCRERFGMKSLTMADVADRVREEGRRPCAA